MPLNKIFLTFIFALFLSLIFNFCIFILFKKTFGFEFLMQARAGVWLIISFIFFTAVFYFAIPLITTFLKEFFKNKTKEKKVGNIKRKEENIEKRFFLTKFLPQAVIYKEKKHENNILKQKKGDEKQEIEIKKWNYKKLTENENLKIPEFEMVKK